MGKSLLQRQNRLRVALKDGNITSRPPSIHTGSIMTDSSDFKSLQDRVQAALITTMRKVNSLTSQDITFRRSVDPAAGDQLDEQRERLLGIASSLINTASSLGVANPFRPRKNVDLEDAEEVDDNWQIIVDALDIALEKADTCIDEYTGLVKRKDAPTLGMGSNAKKAKSSGPLDRSLRYSNMVKPQTTFEVAPDNYASGPWKPLLTEKPHAIVPLEKSLSTFENDDGETQYKHPYEIEILQSRHPDSVYRKRDPIPYTPIEKSAPTYVDTFEGVLEMLEELKKAKEIAVDLEHHDLRTYHGLLSLMQISTRDKDWIVDTLKPWRRQLEILNQVFADPSIVKVFHGAFMDIVWLQRDLGLYVVGLFDTFHAADALMYPSKSLAYLLKKFADFEADKRYQTADWRIRPLPEEMLYYARSDTHYLLYVYDVIRNELIKQSIAGDPHRDLLERTLQRSKETALQRYEPYKSDPDTGRGSRGWLNSINRISNTFSREQFAVYRAVYNWRDKVARATDESPMYLMPNQLLVNIARAMPETAADLRRLFTHVGPPVRQAADELVMLIRDARQQGENGPSILEAIKGDGAMTTFSNVSLTDLASSARLTALGQQDDQIPSAADVTGRRSQLWGSVPMSTLWEKVSKKVDSSSRDERIAVPWSTFVANAMVTEDDGLGKLDEERADCMNVDEYGSIPIEDEAAPPVMEDKQFTLRSGRSGGATGGGKKEESSESSPDEEEDGEEIQRRKAEKKRKKQERRQQKQRLKEEKAVKKAEEKAARKAAKKALKGPNKDGDNVDEEDDDENNEGDHEEEPFDYSKAQSVMHGKRGNGQDKNNGGSAKVFDPYTSKTTAQGPKPARRTNFEKPGKTATFKR